MKKRKHLLVIAAVVFGVLLGIAPLHAQEAFVDPLALDFGDVEVGDSLTLPLTITSGNPRPLIITSVRIIDDGGGVFEITYRDIIPPELNQDKSLLFEVTFTPSEVNVFAGSLEIESNDYSYQIILVPLSGEGVEPGEPTPGELMEETIAFFDMSVDEGTLFGRGCGWFARLRLCFMRKMLVIADEFIEEGRINAACFMLRRAHKRCDGERRPWDFVGGEAVSDLAELINLVRASLGCD